MRRRNVLLACGGLAFLVLSALRIVSDPGDHIGVVYLHNDNHAPAELAMCADARCRTMAPTKSRPRLSFGTEVPMNVPTEHIPQTYRVVFEGSPVTRCLTLIFDQEPPEHFVVPLSSAKPCAEVH
jgi:hypothetical protein